MKITDFLVQEYDPNDKGKGILHKEATDVNMRLFKSSAFYCQLIMDVINYMDSHLSMTYEDCTAPLGVSAVKLGVPWSIIGFKCKGKNKFCINPRIMRYSPEMTEASTNCGALRLKQDIRVKRANLIDLEYYDLKGQRIVEKNIGRYEGSFVIQHECDHILGICITDREIKAK